LCIPFALFIYFKIKLEGTSAANPPRGNLTR